MRRRILNGCLEGRRMGGLRPIPKSDRRKCRACGNTICACIPVRDEQAPETEEAEKTITIEVRGGCVVDVRNLPKGYTYELIDHNA